MRSLYDGLLDLAEFVLVLGFLFLLETSFQNILVVKRNAKRVILIQSSLRL